MDPITLSALLSAGTSLASGMMAKKPEPQMKGDPKDFVPGGKYNPGWTGVTPNMPGAFGALMTPPEGPATVAGMEPGQLGDVLGPLFDQLAPMMAKKLSFGGGTPNPAGPGQTPWTGYQGWGRAYSGYGGK